jgi:hypothetical protein
MGDGDGQLVSVRFGVPVEGVDPADGGVFLAKRHRVAAVYVRQDRSETLFVNDEGEVVARWATRLIERISWPDDAAGAAGRRPRVGTLEWRNDVQERHPNAYQAWTAEEEAELADAFHRGMTVAEMAGRHRRRPGGITARLVRLGLVRREDPVQGPAASEQPSSPSATVVEVTDDRCRHELATGTCAICRHDDRPSVYLTAGGIRFHATPDCAALLEGQRHVAARGGTTEPIEMVHRGSARLEGRDPCLQCNPA